MMKGTIEKFKNLDKGKKIVLSIIVPVLLIFIATIIAIISSGMGREEKQLKENPFKNASLDVVGAKKENLNITKSKSEAYQLRDALEKIKADDTTINLDTPQKLITAKQNEQNSRDRTIKKERKRVTENSQLNTNDNNNYSNAEKSKLHKQKEYQPNQVTEPKQPQEQESAAKEKNQEVPVTTSRFYVASQNESTNKSAQNTSSFISAFLESDTKISDGSEIVFILNEDCKINGVEFKKMSIIYCVAKFESDRINITANTILDNKEKIHMVNLIGYNDKFQKGIPYEGKVDHALEEGKEQILDDAVSDIPYGRTARVIGRTINSLEKDKKELQLAAGHILKFKII